MKRITAHSIARPRALDSLVTAFILASFFLLLSTTQTARADSFGVSSTATAYARIHYGELFTLSDSQTSTNLPTALANAYIYNGGYAGAEMSTSALTSLGYNSVSTGGYGFLDTGQPLGTATSAWTDTFHAVGSTTLVLTARFTDFFSTPEYADGLGCMSSVQYNVQISTLASPISLQDSICNPAYAERGEWGLVIINGGSELTVSEIFSVPDDTTFSVSSNLYATNMPGYLVGGLHCAGDSFASASFQLRTLSGSYTTDSGVSYVPEPSTLFLLGSGLPALIGIMQAKGRPRKVGPRKPGVQS